MSKDGVVTMLLYAPIGKNPENGKGIDGEQFAREIYALAEYSEAKKINVRINSVGGSVMEGFSIFSAIQNSTIKVDTYIDGMAASIAGVIAMAGRKVYMADIGMLMIHDPAMDNKEPKTNKDREILGLIKNSLCTTLTNKTGFTKEAMDEMMSKETWMGCSDAIKCGFVDEVFTTNKKLPKVTDGKGIVNSSKLYAIYNTLLINPTIMNRTLKLLGLQNEASDDAIADAIGALNQKIADATATIEKLKTEKTELEAKISKIEADETAKVEAEATELVTNAVKLNKITDAEKDSWMKLAKVDLSAVKNAFEAMGKSSSPTKITNAIKNAPAVKIAEDRKDWTARDWEKKDPKGWSTLKVDNQAEFERIFKDTYKTDYKF